MPLISNRSVLATAPASALPEPIPDPVEQEIREALDLINPPPPNPPMSVAIAKDVAPALRAFCKSNGYTAKDVVDVALRDYLSLPDPPPSPPASPKVTVPGTPFAVPIPAASAPTPPADIIADPATLNSLDNFLDDGE